MTTAGDFTFPLGRHRSPGFSQDYWAVAMALAPEHTAQALGWLWDGVGLGMGSGSRAGTGTGPGRGRRNPKRVTMITAFPGGVPGKAGVSAPPVGQLTPQSGAG